MSVIKITIFALSISCMMNHVAFSLFFFSRSEPKRNITIMINPAGDAQHTGRRLDDSFERAITLQIAESLKKKIEEEHTNVQVVLTRSPGESGAYLQYAGFANRLDVDFYVSINCYADKETKPSLSLYQFSYGNDFATKQFDLSLIPYDQAHVANITKSNEFGSLMYNILGANEYASSFTVKGIYKIPFKPLIGIKAPSIALEIGLKKIDQWHDYISPLNASLAPIIEKLS